MDAAVVRDLVVGRGRRRVLRTRVGYVTQALSVYADLTVRENARYFAALYGRGAREADAAAASAAGPRSPAPWSASRSCRCWTSRPSGSTRCCA